MKLKSFFIGFFTLLSLLVVQVAYASPNYADNVNDCPVANSFGTVECPFGEFYVGGDCVAQSTVENTLNACLDSGKGEVFNCSNNSCVCSPGTRDCRSKSPGKCLDSGEQQAVDALGAANCSSQNKNFDPCTGQCTSCAGGTELVNGVCLSLEAVNAHVIEVDDRVADLENLELCHFDENDNYVNEAGQPCTESFDPSSLNGQISSLQEQITVAFELFAALLGEDDVTSLIDQLVGADIDSLQATIANLKTYIDESLAALSFDYTAGAGVDIDDQNVISTTLGDKISSNEIQDLGIQTIDLAPNLITSDKIQDGSITAADIADGVLDFPVSGGLDLTCAENEIIKFKNGQWICSDESPYANVAFTAEEADYAEEAASLVDGNLDFQDFGMTCANGQTIKFANGVWGCADDEQGEGGTSVWTGSGGNISYGKGLVGIGSGLTIHPFGSMSATDPLVIKKNSYTPLFTVKNDGKVGVGTDSPNSELDVKGALLAEKVGIGLSNPDVQAKLHVEGNVYADGIESGDGLSVFGSSDFTGSVDIGGSLDVTGSIAADDSIQADEATFNQGFVGSSLPTDHNQPFNVAGDVRIGGGNTAAKDWNSEFLSIDGQSGRWYMGVQNESTESATDFFIGKSSNEDGIFHIQNDGKVGIGTALPVQPLDVRGDVTFGGGSQDYDDNEETIAIRGQSGTWNFGIENKSNEDDSGFFIDFAGGKDHALYLEPGGDLGLGTDKPTQKLHVRGNALVGGKNIYGNDGYFSFSGEGDEAAYFMGAIGNYIKAIWGVGVRIGVVGAPDALVIAKDTGNVGIGLENPSYNAHKLSVEGTARIAEKLFVQDEISAQDDITIGGESPRICFADSDNPGTKECQTGPAYNSVTYSTQSICVNAKSSCSEIQVNCNPFGDFQLVGGGCDCGEKDNIEASYPEGNWWKCRCSGNVPTGEIKATAICVNNQ